MKIRKSKNMLVAVKNANVAASCSGCLPKHMHAQKTVIFELWKRFLDNTWCVGALKTIYIYIYIILHIDLIYIFRVGLCCLMFFLVELHFVTCWLSRFAFQKVNIMKTILRKTSNKQYS